MKPKNIKLGQTNQTATHLNNCFSSITALYITFQVEKKNIEALKVYKNRKFTLSQEYIVDMIN
jgi:hypothetical protein